MLKITSWRHAFKIDPDKEISDYALEKVCESGTDAVIVGGTSGVTFDNTIELLARVRRYSVPAVLEVSNLEAVVPGFDLYFVPLVLNSGDPEWLLQPHQKALKRYGALIPWEQVLVEGYIVLNAASSVAEKTKSKTQLTAEDVKAYARISDQMLGLPITYLEYSGVYGNPTVVKEVREIISSETRLFYGGGIQSPEQAKEMGSYADTIIVGNIIYQDLDAALRTVAAVKSLL